MVGGAARHSSGPASLAERLGRRVAGLTAGQVWLGFSLAGAFGLAAARLGPPDSLAALGPPCLSQTLFGRACPACGMTRALLLLVQGLPAEAQQLHPWSPLVLGLLLLNEAALVGLLAVRAVRRPA